MEPIKHTAFLFEKIIVGQSVSNYTFFESMWSSLTTFANNSESRSLMDKILQWANAHEADNPEFFEFSYLTIGAVEFLSDNFEVANNYLDKAMALYAKRSDEDGIAACSIFKGYLHRSQGDLDLAMKYGLGAIDQLTKSGKHKFFLIIGCYWIGGVYAESGHLEEAHSLFQKGLETDYPMGIKYMGARLTNGRAGVYQQQKNHKLALEHYQKALDLCATTTERTFEARGLTDLGDYYSTIGNWEKAIEYNKKALALRQKMKVVNGSITNYMNLGDLYSKQRRFADALDVLSQSLHLAEEIHVNAKVYQIHKKISDTHLLMGNTSEAFAHYRSFHEIGEEVNHDDMEEKLKKQVQLFQAEQTRKENIVITEQKKEIEKEKGRSDDLLRNILPQEVAAELKMTGTAKARQYKNVTVLFTDFVNFTGISETMNPKELVAEIHKYFSVFDNIIVKNKLEKIKTIGDAYMAVGGIPNETSDHAVKAVNAALDIRDYTQKCKGKFQIRVGLSSGPVVAGIVGVRKYAYDIWGDTVNTASRMESMGEVGKVNVSQATYDLIKNEPAFAFESRGKIEAKGKGNLEMYFVKHKETPSDPGKA